MKNLPDKSNHLRFAIQDMNTYELLAEARTTWGDTRMTLDEIAIAMGVVYGDICREARRVQEGKTPHEEALKKELGNMLFSTIRWCDDLGYSVDECITVAKNAQNNYKKSLNS